MARSTLRGSAAGRDRGILITLFVIYLVLLTWIILWKLEIPYVGAAAGLPRPLKLIPFVPSGDANASAPDEVLANIAFFIPFGLYLGLLAPRRRWWQALGIFLAASLVLETTQHVISTGSFDTSDLLTNTAGGMAGFGLLALLRRRLGSRTLTVMTRIMIAATVLSFVAIGIFFSLHLHYGPRPDVVVPHPLRSH
ncbi:MAG TPA: VanZ family protein [Pseudolysinimonas sp.]|jgi:glycopeptide antibiotics resistance protein